MVATGEHPMRLNTRFSCAFAGLKWLWERWKVVAHKIGNVQARLLLLLFYYVILAPFGLGVRCFADPLRCKRRDLSQWRPKVRSPATVWERARRQF